MDAEQYERSLHRAINSFLWLIDQTVKHPHVRRRVIESFKQSGTSATVRRKAAQILDVPVEEIWPKDIWPDDGTQATAEQPTPARDATA